MIYNLNLFGYEHIISMIIPILLGIIFILIAKKYPDKVRMIGIFLALTIILIRSVRYGFDISIGVFKIQDLLSLHVCNLDFIFLIICLIWPNNKLFTFTFLIGIPTALAVALMPGKLHPDPGLLRAIFFIMSHMMLVMGTIYMLITYKFKITKKDLYSYYILSVIIMALIYIFNTITHANFMYLMEGPKGTVLENMFKLFGPIGYLVVLYLLLITLFTILYGIYILINKELNFVYK